MQNSLKTGLRVAAVAMILAWCRMASVFAAPHAERGGTFEFAATPAEPVVGDEVVVRFTVTKQTDHESLLRTYSISGVAPNFEGDAADHTRSGALDLGQSEVLTYTFRAVHAGTTQFRMFMSSAPCNDAADCAAVAAESPIFPVVVRDAALPPTPTPTFAGGPTRTPTPTSSPAASEGPVLAYGFTAAPPNPRVGDVIRVEFTVRNLRGSVPAVNLAYVISGTSPNLSGNVDLVERPGPLDDVNVDHVVYELSAVQEGVSRLQIHPTYEWCDAGGESCRFGADSSPIFGLPISEAAAPPNSSGGDGHDGDCSLAGADRPPRPGAFVGLLLGGALWLRRRRSRLRA